MIYLVDGETERTLLDSLKRFYKIKSGKVHVLNISNTNEINFKNKLNVLISRKKKAVVVITDTDSLNESANYNRLLSNFDQIKKHKFVTDVSITFQYNLEHELSKALSITYNDLYNKFKTNNVSEFKTALCKDSQETLKRKFLGIEKTDFWSSSYHTLDEIRLRPFKDNLIKVFNK